MRDIKVMGGLREVKFTPLVSQIMSDVGIVAVSCDFTRVGKKETFFLRRAQGVRDLIVVKTSCCILPLFGMPLLRLIIMLAH